MDNDKSKGKIALVTGASSGIGRAIVKHLAQDKINITLVGRNVEKLESVNNEIKQFGIKTLVLSGDLEDDAFLKCCIDKTVEFFGGLDILINNAGIALNSTIEDTSTGQFDQIMKVNIRAPFFLCQAAIKWLRKSEYATVINISSVVGYKGYPNQSAYTASKHALSGFSKALSNEVFEQGIRVHLISPGGVYTDMVSVMRPDLSSEGMIMPEDIANIVGFLINNRSNAVIDEIRVRRTGKEPFA